MKRVNANDPVAFCQMGSERYNEGDHEGAVEYWTKAAELGDEEAHHYLGDRYHQGEGVVEDVEKKVYSHPWARGILGCVEHENGNIERAVKHYIIAANLGYEQFAEICRA